MSDKLPEWPDREACHKYHLKNGTDGWIEDADYYSDLSDAALARMEALVERISAMNQVWVHPVDCPRGHYARSDDPPRTDTCTCGLSELLAACERRSGG